MLRLAGPVRVALALALPSIAPSRIAAVTLRHLWIDHRVLDLLMGTSLNSCLGLSVNPLMELVDGSARAVKVKSANHFQE